MARPRHTACLAGVVLVAALLAPSALVVGQTRLTVRPSSADVAFVDFLEQYSRGHTSVDLSSTAAGLDFARQLRRVGAVWVGATDDPDSARRRLVVATVALEVIDRQFDTAWRPAHTGDLLEWACDLMRVGPAEPAEHYWHLAAVVLLERASALRLIRGRAVGGNSRFVTHVLHAESRFPDDGEWLLARVLDAEHALWPPALSEDVLRPPPDLENRIRSRMRAAFEHPDVQDEAHLRWGYFHLRRGRLAEALAEFDVVGTPADRALRYWLHLFRGQTFGRMGQWPEAVAAYRRAQREFPNAQSATLALGAALVHQGQHADAREIAGRLVSSPAAADPWLIYGAPATRYWPAIVRELRSAMAP